MAVSGKAGLIAVAVAAAALTFAVTLDSNASRESRQAGRYQVVTDGRAIFRLNTSTGEVVVCVPTQERPPQIACGLEAEQRARMQGIARRAEEEIARREPAQAGR